MFSEGIENYRKFKKKRNSKKTLNMQKTKIK